MPPSNSTRGFMATGISSFIPGMFPDHDFAAAFVTKMPDPTSTNIRKT
jgi:hypothetical protein